jgi:DNA mismatch repair ATPase MutL
MDKNSIASSGNSYKEKKERKDICPTKARDSKKKSIGRKKPVIGKKKIARECTSKIHKRQAKNKKNETTKGGSRSLSKTLSEICETLQGTPIQGKNCNSIYWVDQSVIEEPGDNERLLYDSNEASLVFHMPLF